VESKISASHSRGRNVLGLTKKLMHLVEDKHHKHRRLSLFGKLSVKIRTFFGKTVSKTESHSKNLRKTVKM
jgi:hypothetical protein